MAEFPALPLWTDALVGDTYHLTPAEFGAYLRLLIAAWRTPDCAIPNEDIKLGRMVGDPKNWHRLKATVLSFWTLGEDGRYRQKRLLDERDYVSRCAERSAAGGRAKALKRKNRGSAKPLLNECQTSAPTPIPIPIPTKQDSEPNGSSAVAPIPVDLKTRIFGPALAWMSEHTGKTERALRPMLGKWCRDHGDGATLEAMQAAARAGAIEPVAWITAKLEGTTRQTFGQPFKTSELLQGMMEHERHDQAGDPSGDDHALPRALAGPERGPGGDLSNGHYRDAGAVQSNGAGTAQDVGAVQTELDQDGLADARRTVPSPDERTPAAGAARDEV